MSKTVFSPEVAKANPSGALSNQSVLSPKMSSFYFYIVNNSGIYPRGIWTAQYAFTSAFWVKFWIKKKPGSHIMHSCWPLVHYWQFAEHLASSASSSYF